MKKVFITMLLVVGLAVAFSSTPINTAGSLDNVPDPQVKPFSQKNAM